MSAFETLSCSSVLDSAMVIPTGHYSLPASTSNSISSQMNADQREIPVAEVLMSQIEVQKRLQEQLEVQKKLQMRIEAQGKYLQSILEKAQKSLTLDVNNPINLEATKAKFSEFINLALSSLIENVNGEERNPNSIDKCILNSINSKMPESNIMGIDNHEDKKDVKLSLDGASIILI